MGGGPGALPVLLLGKCGLCLQQGFLAPIPRENIGMLSFRIKFRIIALIWLLQHTSHREGGGGKERRRKEEEVWYSSVYSPMNTT